MSVEEDEPRFRDAAGYDRDLEQRVERELSSPRRSLSVEVRRARDVARLLQLFEQERNPAERAALVDSLRIALELTAIDLNSLSRNVPLAVLPPDGIDRLVARYDRLAAVPESGLPGRRSEAVGLALELEVLRRLASGSALSRRGLGRICQVAIILLGLAALGVAQLMLRFPGYPAQYAAVPAYQAAVTVALISVLLIATCFVVLLPAGILLLITRDQRGERAPSREERRTLRRLRPEALRMLRAALGAPESRRRNPITLVRAYLETVLPGRSAERAGSGAAATAGHSAPGAPSPWA